MTAEHARTLFNYDPQTGVFTWVKNGEKVGVLSGNGYYKVSIKKKKYYLHRLAWLHFYGVEPDGDIDHINGNGLDNSITNLRCVSHRINMTNKKDHRAGKVLGVRYNKKCVKNPWFSAIKVNGVQIGLGYYPTQDEAHAAYMKALEKVEKGGIPDGYVPRQKRKSGFYRWKIVHASSTIHAAMDAGDTVKVP